MPGEFTYENMLRFPVFFFISFGEFKNMKMLHERNRSLFLASLKKTQQTPIVWNKECFSKQYMEVLLPPLRPLPSIPLFNFFLSTNPYLKII